MPDSNVPADRPSIDRPTADRSSADGPTADRPPVDRPRVVLTWVTPSVDDGRWPAKRSIGEDVTVRAGLIVDGHDKISAELFFRHEEQKERVARMALKYNDEYYATFPIDQLGRYFYRVRAWIDQFATWQDQFERRVQGGDSE